MMDWYFHQREAQSRGYLRVCGIDEAGRGPLAGPVCAVAVILPDGLEIEGLNDSKKLTEKKREALFDVITARAEAYGIGWASEQEIDQVNILQATFLAMTRAVEALSLPADGHKALVRQAGQVGVDGVGRPAEGGEPVLQGGPGGVRPGGPEGFHNFQFGVGQALHTNTSTSNVVNFYTTLVVDVCPVTRRLQIRRQHGSTVHAA